MGGLPKLTFNTSSLNVILAFQSSFCIVKQTKKIIIFSVRLTKKVIFLSVDEHVFSVNELLFL